MQPTNFTEAKPGQSCFPQLNSYPPTLLVPYPPHPPYTRTSRAGALSGISNLFTFSAAVVRANGFCDDATAQVHALTHPNP